MIIREKFIFWFLLPVLFAAIMVGVNVQEKKRQSCDEFLKDIESVTEKAKVKKKITADNHDIDGFKKQDTVEDYPILMERSIFLKPVSEVKDEKETNIILLKEEEPKRPKFVYKGKMMVGGNIIVIIEDESIDKSFSVKEGDTTDNFTVLGIGEKEIRLKKKDGEEISISTVKEQKVGEGLKPSPTDKETEGSK